MCPLTGKVTASVGFTLGFPGFNTEGPTLQEPQLSLANRDGLSALGWLAHSSWTVEG